MVKKELKELKAVIKQETNLIQEIIDVIKKKTGSIFISKGNDTLKIGSSSSDEILRNTSALDYPLVIESMKKSLHKRQIMKLTNNKLLQSTSALNWPSIIEFLK